MLSFSNTILSTETFKNMKKQRTASQADFSGFIQFRVQVGIAPNRKLIEIHFRIAPPPPKVSFLNNASVLDNYFRAFDLWYNLWRSF